MNTRVKMARLEVQVPASLLQAFHNRYSKIGARKALIMAALKAAVEAPLLSDRLLRHYRMDVINELADIEAPVPEEGTPEDEVTEEEIAARVGGDALVADEAD